MSVDNIDEAERKAALYSDFYELFIKLKKASESAEKNIMIEASIKYGIPLELIEKWLTYLKDNK